MKRFLVLAIAATALSACATRTAEAEKPTVTYEVVQANTAIPFANNIRNFRVGADRSLLLEGPNGRWYRATLSAPCRSSLPWEQKIAVKSDASNRFDRFSRVIVDGQVCAVDTLDQIASPDGVPVKE